MHPASSSRLLDGHDGATIEVWVDEPARRCGPTFVLLPSSQRDSRDFDQLAQRLARAGHRVLRPQPRGMGRSSAPPAAFTLRTLAADVARTIEELGNGPAIVAGHAFGHFVARVTDLHHSQQVCGVVVMAGAAREIPADLPAALDRAADPTAPRAERLAELRRAFFAPGNDPAAWLEGWHPELRQAYRAAGAEPPKDIWWPVSHAPILDLQASDDPWRPLHTHGELRDALGDQVTVRVVPGASHALIPEQPQAVAEALLQWAAALGLRAG